MSLGFAIPTPNSPAGAPTPAEPVDTTPPAPIVVTKGDGNFALSTTVGSWVDIDAGGNASARPFDLVFPNVSAGQWITVEPFAWSASTSGAVLLDAWTIVGGAAVNRFGSGDNGGVPVSPWALAANVAQAMSGSKSYQVKVEDIENGSVRVRLRSRHVSGAARSLLGIFGYEVRLEGRGPFV
jgi:hypothetical protein